MVVSNGKQFWVFKEPREKQKTFQVGPEGGRETRHEQKTLLNEAESFREA